VIKNLLIITNNPNRPSYRQRIESFLPYLRGKGVNVRVEKLPKGKVSRWKLFKSAGDFDTVLLHKKCLNLVDALLLGRFSNTIVYDFDDAVMFSATKPESDKTSHYRLFKRTVKLADCVIAGNDYLAARAAAWCSKLRILPTGLEIGPYNQKPEKTDNLVRLVWIGSASTLKYLQEIIPALDALAADYPDIVLRVIADQFPRADKIKIEKHQWLLDTQAQELAACDIGLAPLPENRFTEGKCGFKILQYFAASLPVIASPVGVNADFIEESNAGICASTPAQWQNAVRKLFENPQLRFQMGQKARQFVQPFDISKLAEKFYNMIKDS
jgi:glycosyltransferase involved in cell wall biosynthesis